MSIAVAGCILVKTKIMIDSPSDLLLAMNVRALVS